MAMGRRSVLFVAVLTIDVFLVIVGLFLIVAPAMAVEPICPGGSSPRPDIVKCVDFDVLTKCTTGQENQCWNDNGYAVGAIKNPDPAHAFRVASGGAAVGQGYIRGFAQGGGTGSWGFNFLEPVPGLSSTAMNFRYYMKKSAGFISFSGGHNIQMNNFDSVSGCGQALKFQHSNYSGEVSYAGNCTPKGSFGLTPNTGRSTIILNNRWYLVEVQGILDTVCTDVNDNHGCNGIVRVWLDEQLILEYTDVNLGGVFRGGRIRWGKIMLVPQGYYHNIVPPWGFEVAYDNVAISNTGTYIGPAANENPRGTGDPASPYRNYNGMDAFLGRKLAPDCTGPGGYLSNAGTQYRSGGSLDTAITHRAYVSVPACVKTIAQMTGSYAGRPVNTLVTVRDGVNSTDCTTGGGTTQHTCRWTGTAWAATSATDSALKITLTGNSDGGGVVWFRGTVDLHNPPQHVIHAWIYLPSSNNYTVTNLALTGFVRDFFNGATGGYVALSLSGGKWAIAQRNTAGVSQPPLVSTLTATFNAWHEYELIVWNDNTVSLMVDRQRLFTKATLPSTASWMFSTTANPGMVVGVIDFQGTAPFVAYYDDAGLATVSYWSCDGWGPASCPFGGLGTVPVAPSGLTVR